MAGLILKEYFYNNDQWNTVHAGLGTTDWKRTRAEVCVFNTNKNREKLRIFDITLILSASGRLGVSGSGKSLQDHPFAHPSISDYVCTRRVRAYCMVMSLSGHVFSSSRKPLLSEANNDSNRRNYA